MNPLKRRTLGTKNKPLMHNADGGPIIRRGDKSPGANKEPNWLPAPGGPI